MIVKKDIFSASLDYHERCTTNEHDWKYDKYKYLSTYGTTRKKNQTGKINHERMKKK